MDNIAIIHLQDKSKSFALEFSEPTHLKWETCLRHIVFLPSYDIQKIPSDLTILRDHQAYAELLEIICGLQSPVLGETQVLGQFKNFLREHREAGHPLVLRHWGYFQALLNEAKSLREQNRGLLNSAGYGSITRKLLKGAKRVALIGSGELAEEIYALNHKGSACSVFTRNTKKDFFGTTLHSLDLLHSEFDAVVIAAPVGNELLKPHLENWKIVIDWRAEESLAESPRSLSYYPINQLFEIHEAEKRSAGLVAEQVRQNIRQRARAFFEKVSLRPQGWEDVCA